jgi:integrase/recombinase XerD
MKKVLPNYLTFEELEQLFEVADRDRSTMGVRNRIMLYIMYVTGMRVSELIALRLEHVHRDTAIIAIEGKRGRQRLVPIPDAMMKELLDYIDGTRTILITGYGACDYLFPVIYGKKAKTLTRQAFWSIIKQLWKFTGSARSISPHVLRHSFATHMLNKGANLRSLQMLLGHENLATVQVYTHVETEHLRKIYDKKHPRS